MRRKQIINPLVGYARRAIGPFSYRIGQSTYAQTFGRRAQEVFSMLGFGADADGRIRMLPRGAGSVTFTRDTAGSITDFEGLVQTGLAEEMRFDKARRVKNLWTAPGGTENFNAGFIYSRGASIDPSDNRTVTIEISVLGDGSGGLSNAYALDVSPGEIYTYSIETRDGTVEDLQAAVYDLTNTTFMFEDMPVVVGGRSSKTFTVPAGCVQLIFYNLRGVSKSGWVTYENIQIENVTGETNQNPGEYTSKGVLSGPSYHGVNVDGVAEFAYENGNSVDGNGVVTEAKDADLTTEWGALFEPGSTNETIQSLDFTISPEWGITGDTTTAETSNKSPVLNKNWWKLSALAGGSGTRTLATFASKSAAVGYWTQSVHVKAEEVSWIRLETYNNNGLSIVSDYYDLTNGVTGTPSSTVWSHVKSTIEQLAAGEYRITLTVLTDALDTIIKTRISLAEADGDATITLNAGDGLLIQGHDLEPRQVVTSFIPTDGTAVTRTIDDGSEMFDLEGNFDQRKGSLVVDLRWTSNYDDISEAVEELIAVSQLTRGLLFYCSNPSPIPIGLYSYDQTNLCRIDLPFVANKTYRVGLTWSVANGINLSWRNITDAGAWQTWANTPFDGMYTTVGTSIRIARPDDLYRPVLFRDLRIWQQDQGTDFIEDNY